MAKNNKYTSINFNHVYEKTVSSKSNSNINGTNKLKNPSLSPSQSYSSASYSSVSAPNKPHGRILVLTRPTPKPVTPPPPQHPIQQVPDQTRSEPGSDAISLRPLGRTGTGSSFSSSPVLNHDKDKDLPSPQPPKPDKFVPPHLRPGFVRREDGPGPEMGRSREDRRPKSGGVYERMRRVGGSDIGIMGRGNRPSSSG
ncbi:uncharacterized protein LOC133307208 [Gastrolobium bilobum]|uniref:uncharacterized protein LOC133307208 n=1 Tax=Gastrolobium bilobum TaxID=150636 RepID=UPI002AB1154D|nr:uncharacterized protein LOC133307208 [Gastrolobium bilobum]